MEFTKDNGHKCHQVRQLVALSTEDALLEMKTFCNFHFLQFCRDCQILQKLENARMLQTMYISLRRGVHEANDITISRQQYNE